LERPNGGPDDPGSNVLSVDGDPGRLRQALGNLVSNPVRYSWAGDRVTVRAHGHTADQPDVVVDVVDTGTGIPADDLPHVFDRFWRADASRTRATGGSGLGLAICRELVEAHGGHITATSTLGEGSTFTVHLPATPPA
jgi:signal transduction histidine kinase